MSETKYLKTSTGPIPLEFPIYATAAEFDAAAGVSDGDEGSCVFVASQNLVFRGHIGVFQDAFASKIAELTGIARSVDDEATEKAKAKAKDANNVKPVEEKFSTYLERVLGEVSPEDAKALILAGTELSRTLPVDASPRARQAGGPRIGVQAYTAADDLLSRTPEAIEVGITKLLGKAAALEVTFDLQRDPETGLPVRASLAEFISALIAAAKAV